MHKCAETLFYDFIFHLDAFSPECLYCKSVCHVYRKMLINGYANTETNAYVCQVCSEQFAIVINRNELKIEMLNISCNEFGERNRRLNRRIETNKRNILPIF